MKSIVFSFKKRDFRKPVKVRKLEFSDFRYILKRYGIQIILIVVFFIGLVFGAIYAGNADTSMLNSLDFLFTTNLDARLSQNAVGTFCACFASDFIFLFAIFLLGVTPWGIPVISAVIFFKGFGTGLTAGYLFVTYSLKGAGFYFLILLPGTFLFCLALVFLSTSAFAISKQMFFNVITNNSRSAPLKDRLLLFCSRSVSALIMTFCSTLLDTVLWTLFAGAFNFN